MHWIWQFIISHRSTTSLLLTVLLSLIMISSDKQRQQNIVKTLTLTVFSPVQVTLGTFYQLNNIVDENKKLRERIVFVELENASFRERIDVVDTNDVRTDALAYYEIVPAEIIAREPSFFYRTAIINVGANHGIKPLMPVISSDGVVGKVITVLHFTSQIRMLYAPDEYVSVEHEETGVVGILNSKIDGTFFSDMRSVDEINTGDLFITTGLGGIYPRGLNVGIVQKIDKPSGGQILKRVHIKSYVDYDKLRNVFVIKSDAQWEAVKNEIFEYEETEKGGVN